MNGMKNTVTNRFDFGLFDTPITEKEFMNLNPGSFVRFIRQIGNIPEVDIIVEIGEARNYKKEEPTFSTTKIDIKVFNEIKYIKGNKEEREYLENQIGSSWDIHKNECTDENTQLLVMDRLKYPEYFI